MFPFPRQVQAGTGWGSTLVNRGRGPIRVGKSIMGRQMVLGGFLQAQNCTNFALSWRHPEARLDFMSADYYRDIARILEDGKFHFAFFDDRLAMPDR